VPSRVVAEHDEGVVGADAQPLDQHALGLLDHHPAVKGLLELPVEEAGLVDRAGVRARAQRAVRATRGLRPAAARR